MDLVKAVPAADKVVRVEVVRAVVAPVARAVAVVNNRFTSRRKCFWVGSIQVVERESRTSSVPPRTATASFETTSLAKERAFTT